MSDDIGIPPVESFKQLKERLAQEQAHKTKEDIVQETGGIDLDNLPRQKHNWVQRGLKVSCEGALHSHHSHFLVNRGSHD